MPQRTRWGDGGAMECLENDVGIMREINLTVLTMIEKYGEGISG